MLLLPFAMIGVYAIAFIEFLRSLPIASVFNPEHPGAAYYIHPAAGIARINGKFVQLSTSQAPAHLFELGRPIITSLANSATFNTTPVLPRPGTGAPAAVQMGIILSLCAVLALRLVSKRVLTKGTLALASSTSHVGFFGKPQGGMPSLTPVSFAESFYAACGMPTNVHVIDPENTQPVTPNVEFGGGGQSPISVVHPAAAAWVHQESSAQSYAAHGVSMDVVVIDRNSMQRRVLNAEAAAVVQVGSRLVFAQVELYGGELTVKVFIVKRSNPAPGSFAVQCPACQLASDRQYHPVTVPSQGSLDPASLTLGQALQRRILPSSSNSGRQLPRTQVLCVQIGNLRLLALKTVDFLFDGPRPPAVLASEICLGPIRPQHIAVTMASRDARPYPPVSDRPSDPISDESLGVCPREFGIEDQSILGPEPATTDDSAPSNSTVLQSASDLPVTPPLGSELPTEQRDLLVPTDSGENVGQRPQEPSDPAVAAHSPCEQSVSDTPPVMPGSDSPPEEGDSPVVPHAGQGETLGEIPSVDTSSSSAMAPDTTALVNSHTSVDAPGTDTGIASGDPAGLRAEPSSGAGTSASTSTESGLPSKEEADQLVEAWETIFGQRLGGRGRQPGGSNTGNTARQPGGSNTGNTGRQPSGSNTGNTGRVCWRCSRSGHTQAACRNNHNPRSRRGA